MCDPKLMFTADISPPGVDDDVFDDDYDDRDTAKEVQTINSFHHNILR